MPKWEYLSIELVDEAKKEGVSEFKDVPDFRSVLDKYGSNGWELVDVTSAALYIGRQTITRFFAFFKKQK